MLYVSSEEEVLRSILPWVTPPVKRRHVIPRFIWVAVVLLFETVLFKKSDCNNFYTKGLGVDILKEHLLLEHFCTQESNAVNWGSVCCASFSWFEWGSSISSTLNQAWPPIIFHSHAHKYTWTNVPVKVCFKSVTDSEFAYMATALNIQNMTLMMQK